MAQPYSRQAAGMVLDATAVWYNHGIAFVWRLSMSPTSEQLLISALALPEAERLELAEALLAASEPPVPEPTGDAWLAEMQRRSAQIDAGEAALAPWPVVKQRVRARLEGQSGG